MPDKPLLLDLFCGAGGCTRGYQQAGFTVVGVDLDPQPHYIGDDFIQGDAVQILLHLLAGGSIQGKHREYRLSDFAAIHASPPCQKFSSMRKGRWQDRDHPDLLEPIRELLRQCPQPYVIENVIGAPMIQPVMLCGTMFGLGTSEGSQLRRHRLFEYSWPALILTPGCNHNDGSPIGVYGGGQHPNKRRPASIAVYGNSGGHSKRDNLDHYGVAARREAMGIDWMTQGELSEAIPPAYTKFMGTYLMLEVEKRNG